MLLWIGGLKAFRYEADGIVPFVANSPFMSFFYADPGNYKAHKNPEGALVPENRSWHEANRTYEFAYRPGNGDRAVRPAALPASVAARRRRRSAASWSS